jgi:sugar phosphate isomerase/epimerase
MAGRIESVGQFREGMIGRPLLEIWRDIKAPSKDEKASMVKTLAVKDHESHPAVFNGGMAGMPLDQFAAVYSGEAGAQGLELGHWTQNLSNGVALDWSKLSTDPAYAERVNQIVIDNGMPKGIIALSSHLLGQVVSDAVLHDGHQAILSPNIWGKTKVDENGIVTNKRQQNELRTRAKKELIKGLQVAVNLGLPALKGFTGSRSWNREAYSFPPHSKQQYMREMQLFRDDWMPLLDEFAARNLKFAKEIHPTEQAFDPMTFLYTMLALESREEYGVNFDPSHTVHQQGYTPEEALTIYILLARLYAVHVKDSSVNPNGKAGKYQAGQPFGSPQNGWDFKTPGRGDVKWYELAKTLHANGIHKLPLPIEWEENGRMPVEGVKEAVDVIKRDMLWTYNAADFQEGMESSSK